MYVYICSVCSEPFDPVMHSLDVVKKGDHVIRSPVIPGGPSVSTMLIAHRRNTRFGLGRFQFDVSSH